MIETTRVVLFEGTGDQTFTIPYAIEWLQGLLNDVPLECRGDTLFEIETDCDGYDELAYPTVAVSYRRPRTAIEIAQRLADEHAIIAYREEIERAHFAVLKAKYGND